MKIVKVALLSLALASSSSVFSMSEYQPQRISISTAAHYEHSPATEPTFFFCDTKPFVALGTATICLTAAYQIAKTIAQLHALHANSPVRYEGESAQDFETRRAEHAELIKNTTPSWMPVIAAAGVVTFAGLVLQKGIARSLQKYIPEFIQRKMPNRFLKTINLLAPDGAGFTPQYSYSGEHE